MKTILIGEYIKENRELKGMTQEQLCGGICTAATLSRIENGRQNPSRDTVNSLLRRLGEPTDRFFALVNKREMEMEKLREDIQADCIQYHRSGQPEIREAALAKLSRLEQIMEKNNKVARQYILSAKVTLGRPDGPFSFEEKLDMLMKAIRLTIPGFNLKKIYLHRYSIVETTIINQIARAYSEAGEKRKAIDIYRQLLNFIEEHDPKFAGYATHFCLVAHDYAINLGLEKRYEEAMEIANRGWQVSVEKGTYQFLPGFLAILAECHYFTGNKEKSRELYIQAYCIYKAFKDEANLAIMRREMKERLGMEPPV